MPQSNENLVVLRREQEALLHPGNHPSRRTLRESILRIGDIEGHNGNRPYNVLMDLIIFIVTSCEIGIVLYLSYTHFSHARGLMAVAMLLPILLNFVGVTYFLSDPNERKELEKSGRPCRCATDFLQFPILGPVFTAFKVLTISCGCSQHKSYERIEASAIKMRQSGGFFTAAPEAMVQLTVLFANTVEEMLTFDAYLEMFAVVLFTMTLAESNCYNPLSDYYKMFVPYKAYEWRLGEVPLWKKIILFLQAFFSIASRIISTAMLNASVLYFCENQGYVDTPLMLVLIFLGQMTYRLAFHYLCQLVYHCFRDEEIPSGCYESINYAWRSVLLNYAFQSENIFSQLFFYIENGIFFGIWILSIQRFAPPALMKTLKEPVTILQLTISSLSVIFLLACIKFRLINVRYPFPANHS